MARKSQNKLDRLLAVPMYIVSLAFLVFLAGALQTMRFEPESTSRQFVFWWCTVSVAGMAVLYPLFIAEVVAQWLNGGRRLAQHILILLFPPLRLGARDHVRGRTVWLPIAGWQYCNYDLRRNTEKAFGGPMIIIALLILPLLVIEYFYEKQVDDHQLMSFLLQTATSVIWMAFTIEFITMLGVVDKKIKYCTTQWLDLAIVILPFAAFLPMLQLGALIRLQQIGKTTRLYRLRGLAIRAYRALLVLDFIRRFLHLNPERRLSWLREAVAERELELDEIRREMIELEEVVAQLQSTEEGGLPPLDQGDPRIGALDIPAPADATHPQGATSPRPAADASGDPTMPPPTSAEAESTSSTD